MVSARKNKEVWKKASYVGLLLFSPPLLIPVVLIVINSFKDEAEFMPGCIKFAAQAVVRYFREVWQLVEFDVKLYNSLLISTSVAFLGLLISVMNAYAIGIGKISDSFSWPFAFAMVIPMKPLHPLYYDETGWPL